MSKILVLQSRNVALFAAQEALRMEGFKGEDFVIDSYQERKHSGNYRFIVLGLITREGGTAEVAVRLEKVEGHWNVRQIEILKIENAPERLLGYLKVFVDLDNAVALLKAFMGSFPSLNGIDPYDVVRSVSNPESLHMEEDLEKEAALLRIQKALDDASYEGEWPGHAIVRNASSWSTGKEVTITPYVGDRSISVFAGDMGFGHGRVWGLLTVTIDCMIRPSASAMREVIKWIAKNGKKFKAEVFWSEGRGGIQYENLFEMNKAMAQYYARFAPEQKAPYRTPNSYADWTLTDWLTGSLSDLEQAERYMSNKESYERGRKQFEREANLVIRLIESNGDVIVTRDFVRDLIADQLRSEEPTFTETSRLYSAEQHARANRLPWPQKIEKEEPTEFLGASKIALMNSLFEDSE